MDEKNIALLQNKIRMLNIKIKSYYDDYNTLCEAKEKLASANTYVTDITSLNNSITTNLTSIGPSYKGMIVPGLNQVLDMNDINIEFESFNKSLNSYKTIFNEIGNEIDQKIKSCADNLNKLNKEITNLRATLNRALSGRG